MKRIINSVVIVALSLLVINDVNAKYTKKRVRVSSVVGEPTMTNQEVKRTLMDSSKAMTDPNLPLEDKKQAVADAKDAINQNPETQQLAVLDAKIDAKQKEIEAKESYIKQMEGHGMIGFLDSQDIKDEKTILSGLKAELSRFKRERQAQTKVVDNQVGKGTSSLVSTAVKGMKALGATAAAAAVGYGAYLYSQK
jgi:hypothetical protein